MAQAAARRNGRSAAGGGAGANNTDSSANDNPGSSANNNSDSNANDNTSSSANNNTDSSITGGAGGGGLQAGQGAGRGGHPSGLSMMTNHGNVCFANCAVFVLRTIMVSKDLDHLLLPLLHYDPSLVSTTN